MQVGEKTCVKCGETLPVTEFYAHKKMSDGRLNTCRKCKIVEHDTWRRRNPERHHASVHRRRLRDTYGITVEQYEAILTSQGGRCAGCRTDSPGPRQRVFALDHDHKTGAIRGLLCHPCNLALGILLDAPSTLRRLADYAEKGSI